MTRDEVWYEVMSVSRHSGQHHEASLLQTQGVALGLLILVLLLLTRLLQ